MTRLNLVDPSELYDQHLFAEFREIKMVPKSLRRSLQAAKARNVPDPVAWVLNRCPKAYTLNTGHVSFFYDKGIYLAARYDRLIRELKRRRFDFNTDSPLDPDNTFSLDRRLMNDYEPTPEALVIIRERIAEKLALRPGWYRYTVIHGEHHADRNS